MARANDEPSGYGQYCPISRALDLFGDRWSLLILRDMVVGATRFNDLARGLPGLSRSLLTKRLRQLERAGVIEHLRGQYLLTESGRDLEPVIFGIGDWGARWTFEAPEEDELDPELLMWWMHTRLDTSDWPGRRQVLQFQFAQLPQRYWIVVELGVASVCRTDPGFDVDVTVTADLSALYQVWLGRLPLRQALRTGTVAFDGPAPLTRRMPKTLLLSPIASRVSAGQAHAKEPA